MTHASRLEAKWGPPSLGTGGQATMSRDEPGATPGPGTGLAPLAMCHEPSIINHEPSKMNHEATYCLKRKSFFREILIKPTEVG